MSDTEGPDVRAGEYVLGVLSEAEMAGVRAQAEIDQGFRAEIVAWETWLAPLASLVPEIAPPPDLWQRLEASIDARPGAINDNARRPGLWRNAVLWRGTTLAALALAAAFAAVAFLPRVPVPSRIAALAPLGGPATAFVAEALPDGVLRVTAIAPAPVPAGRELELWVLPRGATRPESLGTFPPTGRPIEAAAGRVPDGAQLLVSLEPAGGSPTGQPTGAVLYGGVVTGR